MTEISWENVEIFYLFGC